ncbi:hypothetical protein EVAR_61807_1 [Eumeta japonica]|uniref:MADF domain-containing protein n=1 Tax=Eumeta variegata TaxID=151549 RepID=A0A4C1YWN7_EUMVA|nr:hypothetical protein EVAR_61807_1 [Eumeta japonica]
MEHDASMDIDTFISEIHSRPVIWDLHSDLYSNVNENVKAWEKTAQLKAGYKMRLSLAPKLSPKWWQGATAAGGCARWPVCVEPYLSPPTYRVDIPQRRLKKAFKPF